MALALAFARVLHSMSQLAVRYINISNPFPLSNTLYINFSLHNALYTA